MIEATPFATTTAGAVLLPVVAALLVALILTSLRVFPRLNRRLDAQDAQLGRIEHETHLNSGSSLKDAAIRSEGKLDALIDRFDRHLDDSKYDRGRLDALIASRPY